KSSGCSSRTRNWLNWMPTSGTYVAMRNRSGAISVTVVMRVLLAGRLDGCLGAAGGVYDRDEPESMHTSVHRDDGMVPPRLVGCQQSGHMSVQRVGATANGRKRTLQLKRRAERMAETRERIARAAYELHATIGPARTTISAIAARAGVQRHTVYQHFPD